jgi:ubiquinone/menaquinone biosynthesis C-methylase UbiE
MARFSRNFGLTSTTRVLDVGGEIFNWTLLPFIPSLVIANLDSTARPTVVCDARHLPFKDKSFDIVYSNSVIEHVGDWKSQCLFAAECRRVGKSYYVQTPNRWFPVEPHWIGLFIHWMPERSKYLFARFLTVRGLWERPNRKYCEELLAQTRLLTAREMQELFRDAWISRERLAGLTKSIVAECLNHESPRPA